jgi:hypothetical protein
MSFTHGCVGEWARFAWHLAPPNLGYPDSESSFLCRGWCVNSLDTVDVESCFYTGHLWAYTLRRLFFSDPNELDCKTAKLQFRSLIRASSVEQQNVV